MAVVSCVLTGMKEHSKEMGRDMLNVSRVYAHTSENMWINEAKIQEELSAENRQKHAQLKVLSHQAGFASL